MLYDRALVRLLLLSVLGLIPIIIVFAGLSNAHSRPERSFRDGDLDLFFQNPNGARAINFGHESARDSRLMTSMRSLESSSLLPSHLRALTFKSGLDSSTSRKMGGARKLASNARKGAYVKLVKVGLRRRRHVDISQGIGIGNDLDTNGTSVGTDCPLIVSGLNGLIAEVLEIVGSLLGELGLGSVSSSDGLIGLLEDVSSILNKLLKSLGNDIPLLEPLLTQVRILITSLLGRSDSIGLVGGNLSKIEALLLQIEQLLGLCTDKCHGAVYKCNGLINQILDIIAELLNGIGLGKLIDQNSLLQNLLNEISSLLRNILKSLGSDIPILDPVFKVVSNLLRDLIGQPHVISYLPGIEVKITALLHGCFKVPTYCPQPNQPTACDSLTDIIDVTLYRLRKTLLYLCKILPKATSIAPDRRAYLEKLSYDAKYLLEQYFNALGQNNLPLMTDLIGKLVGKLRLLAYEPEVIQLIPGLLTTTRGFVAQLIQFQGLCSIDGPTPPRCTSSGSQTDASIITHNRRYFSLISDVLNELGSLIGLDESSLKKSLSNEVSSNEIATLDSSSNGDKSSTIILKPTQSCSMAILQLRVTLSNLLELLIPICTELPKQTQISPIRRNYLYQLAYNIKASISQALSSLTFSKLGSLVASIQSLVLKIVVLTNQLEILDLSPRLGILTSSLMPALTYANNQCAPNAQPIGCTHESPTQCDIVSNKLSSSLSVLLRTLTSLYKILPKQSTIEQNRRTYLQQLTYAVKTLIGETQIALALNNHPLQEVVFLNFFVKIRELAYQPEVVSLVPTILSSVKQLLALTNQFPGACNVGKSGMKASDLETPDTIPYKEIVRTLEDDGIDVSLRNIIGSVVSKRGLDDTTTLGSSQEQQTDIYDPKPVKETTACTNVLTELKNSIGVVLGYLVPICETLPNRPDIPQVRKDYLLQLVVATKSLAIQTSASVSQSKLQTLLPLIRSFSFKLTLVANQFEIIDIKPNIALLASTFVPIGAKTELYCLKSVPHLSAKTKDDDSTDATKPFKSSNSLFLEADTSDVSDQDIVTSFARSFGGRAMSDVGAIRDMDVLFSDTDTSTSTTTTIHDDARNSTSVGQDCSKVINQLKDGLTIIRDESISQLSEKISNQGQIPIAKRQAVARLTADLQAAIGRVITGLDSKDLKPVKSSLAPLIKRLQSLAENIEIINLVPKLGNQMSSLKPLVSKFSNIC